MNGIQAQGADIARLRSKRVAHLSITARFTAGNYVMKTRRLTEQKDEKHGSSSAEDGQIHII
jgi:hypothetical protein